MDLIVASGSHRGASRTGTAPHALATSAVATSLRAPGPCPVQGADCQGLQPVDGWQTSQERCCGTYAGAVVFLVTAKALNERRHLGRLGIRQCARIRPQVRPHRSQRRKQRAH